MNEAMLEMVVESRMNALDRRLMANKLTQAEYDAAVKALDAEFKPKIERARVLANIQF